MIIALVYVSLLIVIDKTSLNYWPGKLELIGAVILVATFCAMGGLIIVFQTEALGVLFGGLLGMLFVIGAVCCAIGLVFGFLKQKGV